MCLLRLSQVIKVLLTPLHPSPSSSCHSLRQDGDTASFTRRPTLSYEDLGYTRVQVPSARDGHLTVRCKRSMGWETPENIDEKLRDEFGILRMAKTPSPVSHAGEHDPPPCSPASVHYATIRLCANNLGLSPDTVARQLQYYREPTSARAPTGHRDPWGSRAGKRTQVAADFGAVPKKKAVECKAYINQLSKVNCPFATDRRFLAGDWLYKTSTLHQSVPLPDRRYQTVYEKRPLTRSREPAPYSHHRSTRMLLALIHEHMNTRSFATRAAIRRVDTKHPLRAMMKADIGNKGYLTHEELREVLDAIFVVVLEEEEIHRVVIEFASDIPTPDGRTGFNYFAFYQHMNSIGSEHPLGGHAGSSWGYSKPGPAFVAGLRNI